MADENFHEADELGDEEDKGEDEEAEQGVTGNFVGDVTIEDAHEAKGQCNMGEIRYGGTEVTEEVALRYAQGKRVRKS
jgi:hypothetical protein